MDSHASFYFAQNDTELLTIIVRNYNLKIHCHAEGRQPREHPQNENSVIDSHASRWLAQKDKEIL